MSHRIRGRTSSSSTTRWRTRASNPSPHRSRGPSSPAARTSLPPVPEVPGPPDGAGMLRSPAPGRSGAGLHPAWRVSRLSRTRESSSFRRPPRASRPSDDRASHLRPRQRPEHPLRHCPDVSGSRSVRDVGSAGPRGRLIESAVDLIGLRLQVLIIVHVPTPRIAQIVLGSHATPGGSGSVGD